MTARSKRRPAYGALAEKNRDNIYYLGPEGFLFTSPHVATDSTLRHPAAIVLTADGSALDVGPPGATGPEQAIAVAPMVERALYAIDMPLVSVNVQPNHPAFSAFRALPAPGLFPLQRAAFTHLDARLEEAYHGRLDLAAARLLFDELVAITLEQLPRRPRVDARVARLLDMMQTQDEVSLAEMAEQLGMSYTGMSHMFTRAVGISMRSYRLWFKAVTAWSEFETDQTLTDIAHTAGFSDAAHMSREWQHWYGMAPSYLRNERCVRIFSERHPRGRPRE
ncbi:AraC family transcriptional regulator [Alcanivorax sp. JB21]|uniref:helix-turn-helix domain-containing protein n=1 Tax=Alcanivorax limicola TaxID=2874102 RepID=UPI001CBF56FC|nr:AraC family transcriptional regulator [Alcanivorax limicola]MBZ2188217.1 AraC family transcriptional regulator [Alcanivorax limicola]